MLYFWIIYSSETNPLYKLVAHAASRCINELPASVATPPCTTTTSSIPRNRPPPASCCHIIFHPEPPAASRCVNHPLPTGPRTCTHTLENISIYTYNSIYIYILILKYRLVPLPESLAVASHSMMHPPYLPPAVPRSLNHLLHNADGTTRSTTQLKPPTAPCRLNHLQHHAA